MTRPRPSTVFINAAAAPGLPRSAAKTVISTPVDLSSAASASMGSRRRDTSTRSCPSFAASRASAAPMPADAPVTSATGRAELAMPMHPFSFSAVSRRDQILSVGRSAPSSFRSPGCILPGFKLAIAAFYGDHNHRASHRGGWPGKQWRKMVATKRPKRVVGLGRMGESLRVS